MFSLKNKPLKSLVFGLALFFALSVVGYAAYASAGQVYAYASFAYTGDPFAGYTFYGNGRAEELYESPSNVINIYAKSVIGDNYGTALASDETTEHYTTNAYASCSYSISHPTLKYQAATLARARYTDDIVSQDTAYTDYVDFGGIITSDPALVTEFGINASDLKFVPAEAFSSDKRKDNKSYAEISNLETYALIFGDHFIAAQVGDKLPTGVYVNEDGTEAYVFDKKADGNTVMTKYKIDGNKYKVTDTQKRILKDDSKDKSSN